MRIFVFIISLVTFSWFNVYSNESSQGIIHDKENSNFIIQNWSKKDGLPTNSINDLIQTSDGYIWLSTYNGLVRFDGISFTVFDKSNLPEIKQSSFGALAEDSKNVLWVTTQSNRLLSFDGVKFRLHSLDGVDVGLQPVIFIDSKDNVWGCTSDDRLFSFKDDVVKYYKDSILPKGTSYTDIAEDKNGDIWVSTEGQGLFKIANSKVVQYCNENGLGSNWINSIVFDSYGKLWIGNDKGISIFQDGVFSIYKGFSGYTVNDILPSQNGVLWVCTSDGLFRKNVLTTNIQRLTIRDGLINNRVDFIMPGREGGIWLVSYNGGLSRINTSSFYTLTKDDNLSGKVVNTLCQISESTILIGNNNGIIDKIENNRVSSFKTKFNLKGRRIRDIFKDSKNNIWISTYSGLLKISPTGKELWISPDSGFPAKYIRLVFEDREDNIWVATRNNGVIKLIDNEHYLVINKQNGLCDNLVMDISQDKKGRLVVGTSRGGISIIRNDKVIKSYTRKNGLFSNTVFYTYVDNDSVIWVACRDGLNWIKNNVVHGISTSSSSIPYTPYNILEDNLGNLWLGCINGVMMVDKVEIQKYDKAEIKQLNVRLFGKENGIKEPECNPTGAPLHVSDNTLWYPTFNGITVVNPSKIFTNAYVPPVHIESILLDGESFNKNQVTKVKPGIERITFNYVSLSYYNPKKNLFKYKLENFSSSWSNPTSQRSVSYTNLPPGKYTFQVIASNNDGIWNKTGDKISFEVEPYWYQSVVARFGFALLIVLILIFIYRFRVRALRKRGQVLKELVKKRTLEIVQKNERIQERNVEILAVTEELKAQNEEMQSINEELQKLSIVASKTHNAITIANADGEIIWVNDAFTDSYGYSRREYINIIGKKIISKSNKKEISELIKSCIRDKQTVIYSEPFQPKFGNKKWIRTTLSPILNDVGEIINLVAIDTDITEIKIAEEQITKQKNELEKYRSQLEILVDIRTKELKIAKEKAEESDKLKTSFLTNLSHEIRTPMNAIVGFADLLSLPGISQKEATEFIKNINENSDLLLQLIDDIVEVSRIESGLISINKEWVNIEEIISPCFQEYKYKIEGKPGIKFKVEFSNCSSGIKIFTDKYRLSKSIKYLLSNALKFTVKGSIVLGCKVINNDIVQFYVKDSGIGIDKSNYEIIFERFRKIEDKQTKLFRGTGLGLYLTKINITSLGGKVGVESELNKGSCFTLTIPTE